MRAGTQSERMSQKPITRSRMIQVWGCSLRNWRMVKRGMSRYRRPTWGLINHHRAAIVAVFHRRGNKWRSHLHRGMKGGALSISFRIMKSWVTGSNFTPFWGKMTLNRPFKLIIYLIKAWFKVHSNLQKPNSRCCRFKTSHSQKCSLR